MKTPRLKALYEKEVRPALMKHFQYTTVMQAPKVHKVVINMGMGDAKADIKILDTAARELTLIAGQKPILSRSKRAIAAFNLRQGVPIGCFVTLRGSRMYEFLDRLLNIALPRVRDFQGVSAKAFDGLGNYTLGLRDQLVFPEVDYTTVNRITGMNVTIVTTARSDEEAFVLLRGMGMPFRKRKVA